MADLWKEILPSIFKTKKHLLNQENEKDYKPFAINRIVSYYKDAIFHVNEMNKYSSLPQRMQYDYLFHSLKAFYRPYEKVVKKEVQEDIELLKQYYKFSGEKAKVALKILSEEQLDQIRKLMDIGGKQ